MSRDIKYIGYLESQIGQYHVAFRTMSRGEEAVPQVCLRLETARFDSPLLLDIVLRCYRPFRKARRLSGGL